VFVVAIMPQFVQSASSKGYSLVEPRLDWARGKVSLLDGAVIRLENIVPQLIAGADKIIDGTIDVVDNRTKPVRDGVVNRIEPIRAGVATRLEPVTVKLGEVQQGAYTRSLGLVDASESLIDRLLPVPVQAVKKAGEENDEETQSRLVARVAYLPFRAPVRITMIMFVNASGAVQTIQISGRHAAGVAYERQQQFAQAVLQRAKPLTDRVGAMSETTLARVRKGRDAASLKLHDGKEYVTVMVNGVVVRLKLAEAKDWTTDKVDRARAGTVAVVVKGVQIAHDTTGRIIGKDRATYLFTSLYLPVQQQQSPTPKPAVAVAHANTHHLGTAQKPTTGAGKLTELKVGGKITEVKAPAVVNGAIAG